MPLYEYQCTQCGEREEILQKLNDPPYSHCPQCGGDMRKLISSPAIQFKGSGFYKTDYANSSSTSKGDGKGESSSKSESSSKGESSSKSESASTSTSSETKSDSGKSSN